MRVIYTYTQAAIWLCITIWGVLYIVSLLADFNNTMDYNMQSKDWLLWCLYFIWTNQVIRRYESNKI